MAKYIEQRQPSNTGAKLGIHGCNLIPGGQNIGFLMDTPFSTEISKRCTLRCCPINWPSRLKQDRCYKFLSFPAPGRSLRTDKCDCSPLSLPRKRRFPHAHSVHRLENRSCHRDSRTSRTAGQYPHLAVLPARYIAGSR